MNKCAFVRRAMLATALLSIAVSCHASPKKLGESPRMASTYATSASDVATFCLGHFLIDLPPGSKVDGGSYKYQFSRVEPPVAMPRERFEQEVQAREQQLRSIRHEREPSLLRLAQRPTDNSQVLAFFPEPYIAAGIDIEGRTWVEGVRYLLTAQVDPDKQSNGISRVADQIARIRPRADTDIPTDAGYCFGGGFIANSEWQNEEAGVDFDIAGHPDIRLSVLILPLAAHKRSAPLLDRLEGGLAGLGSLASSVQFLRKRDRVLGPFHEGAMEIGPFKGQEYLAIAPNSGEMRAHTFMWDTQGEGTLQEPAVEIAMTTGNYDDKGNAQRTRLTDGQAIELWDRIVGSFRLRPTRPVGAVETSDAVPPVVALGALAATGRACPRDGWWECAERSAPVQGGRRQRFVLAERMPPAILLGEPSVWQKLKGEQPRHSIATVWKLVALEPAPGDATAASAPTN